MGTGSTYTSRHASQQWELDALGNWSDRITDADHDGSFVDFDGDGYKDERLHNAANEIESGLQYDRRIFSSAANTVYQDHRYDDNGNMTDERRGTALPSPGTLMAGQVHTYDAWNRLIESSYVTSGGSATMISQNTYNALGWRTSRAFDESRGAYDGLDQKRVYSYGADWRLLEEWVDIDVDTDSDSVGGTDDDVDWIGQQFWGIRYIDDAVGKRVDRDGDGDFVDADCTYWYQLTDTQFSVGVVLDVDGYVYERIEYDAYGVANHRYAADADGDNSVSSTDTSLNGGDNTIDLTGYHADLDVDCDGDFDSVDVSAIMGYTPFSPFPYAGLPDGWISDPSSSDGPDNWVGYAGYVFNHEREDYSVRHRVYIPELGRWRQRDPIEYIGGRTLYAYAFSNPLVYIDPLGLEPEDPDECDRQKERLKNLEENLANNCPDQAEGLGLTEEGMIDAAGNVASSAADAVATADNAKDKAINKQMEEARDRHVRDRTPAAQRRKELGALEAAKSNKSAAKAVLGTLGGVVGAAGTISDGNDTLNAIDNGDTLGAIGSASSTILGVVGTVIPPVGLAAGLTELGASAFDRAHQAHTNAQYANANNANCGRLAKEHPKVKQAVADACGDCQ